MVVEFGNHNIESIPEGWPVCRRKIRIRPPSANKVCKGSFFGSDGRQEKKDGERTLRTGKEGMTLRKDCTKGRGDRLRYEI